jgi:hypothetical protein
MRKMRGGGDFRIFLVCFDTPTVSTHQEFLQNIRKIGGTSGSLHRTRGILDTTFRSSLVGSLCYYPGNGDFYFCGYKHFKPESGSRNGIVRKIICKLCGIQEDSDCGAKFLSRFSSMPGGILEYVERPHPNNHIDSEIIGIKSENVECCIRLNNPKLSSSLELSFFKPHRVINRSLKWNSDGEKKYDHTGNQATEVIADKTTTENISICKFKSKLPTLDNSDFFKLLDIKEYATDPLASVFLDDYTPYVVETAKFGARTYNNDYYSAIRHGNMIGFARKVWNLPNWTKYRNYDDEFGGPPDRQ